MNATEARMVEFCVTPGPMEPADVEHTEWLWGEWVGPGRVKVRDTPFGTNALAMDDVVQVAEDDGGWTFLRVVEPGGRRTVQGFYDPRDDDEKRALHDHFRAHDVPCELGFEGDFSLAVPREIDREMLHEIAARCPVDVIGLRAGSDG